jgi:hypothetical protein
MFLHAYKNKECPLFALELPECIMPRKPFLELGPFNIYEPATSATGY